MHMLHIYGAIIFLYVALRLIIPAPIPVIAKLFLALPAFVATQYHFFVRYYFGTLSSPEMPYPLLVITSFSFIFMAVLFLLLLVRDLVLLIIFLVKLAVGPKVIPFSPGRRTVLSAGLGLAVGVYGYHSAVCVPEVRTTEIIFDRLPTELDGLSIIQITDLHATALLNAARVRWVVAAVNAANPDIIVTTGDMVDGSVTRRAADVAPLRDLKARYGIYGCEGNHEYYSGYSSWMRAFEKMGMPLLHNAHKVLYIKGKQLVMAGVNDQVGDGPDLEKALAGAPSGVPVILLAHRPGFAQLNSEHGVGLQLSGHTHGGQVLGFDRIVASRNGGFTRGLYTVGNMKLYVCPGAGLWTGFPIRLGVPSEIARIVLRSGAA